jgi:hypothetical protein
MRRALLIGVILFGMISVANPTQEWLTDPFGKCSLITMAHVTVVHAGIVYVCVGR